MRIILIIILSIVFYSCSNNKNQNNSNSEVAESKQSAERPEAFAQYRDITGLVDAEEFYRLIQTCDSVKIYDIRPREVYISEPRIKGAKLIYDFSYFKEALQTLHRDHQIMVYCGKELRSPAAVNALVKLGFNNVYELQGGLAAWKNKRLPLVDTDGNEYKYSSMK
ncbi:rhodanese-like domain-containing protein [Marinifilum fragile]|uniref:rhodanese-like domain-containing protein n=1 Tax=Marinifilum fragile TaxID=570161 RepID=UPI002AABA4FD|nr:rhodanese-like domain-containing protein [Marinifilum fragile]